MRHHHAPVLGVGADVGHLVPVRDAIQTGDDNPGDTAACHGQRRESVASEGRARRRTLATLVPAASASRQEPALAGLLGTTRTAHYFTRPTDSVGAVPDGPEWITKPDILRSGRM